ncbi:hypothetical protein BD410DRAFT_845204 [Rickenella mellea]|uniref:Uncharacterized protein n=1 Tax=Rickenella mellea TaxID=50990 RepID=A0A4Y7PJL0_9AGAM|nr:hypothetical protein BD410DRAFT_845204 [Rickenella mellea]
MSNSTQYHGHPSQTLGSHTNRLYLYAGVDSHAQDDRHFIIWFRENSGICAAAERACSCEAYNIWQALQSQGSLPDPDTIPTRHSTVDWIGTVNARHEDEMTVALFKPDTVTEDFGLATLENGRLFRCMYLSHKQLLNLHEWGKVDWNLTNLRKVVDAHKAYEIHLLNKSPNQSTFLRLINNSEMSTKFHDMINQLERREVPFHLQ